jgi:hypothetical protein
MLTHVELWWMHIEYATRERFGGLGLKTIGWTVFGFGPQNPGAVPAGIGGTCGVITMLVSRRS